MALRQCVLVLFVCNLSAASSTHVSLPFTAYSTPSTSPANRFVSVGPRDPSFVNIPQQTQVGRFRLLCMPAASSSSVSSNVSPRSQLHCRCHLTHMVSVTTVKCHLQFVCLLLVCCFVWFFWFWVFLLLVVFFLGLPSNNAAFVTGKMSLAF